MIHLQELQTALQSDKRPERKPRQVEVKEELPTRRELIKEVERLIAEISR